MGLCQTKENFEIDDIDLDEFQPLPTLNEIKRRRNIKRESILMHKKQTIQDIYKNELKMFFK
jgi:hypothetical protein